MKYPLIHAKLFNELWLIDPASHRAMQETFILHLSGGAPALATKAEEGDDKPALTTLAQSLGGTASSRNRYLMTYGNTGVISMYGILGKHMSSLEAACGGCSLDTVQNAMDILAADSSIKKVVLDISSPGGQTIGTEETAKMFRELATHHGKKTYSVTETQMGSAAYWIGSQAQNGLFVAPSAVAGSIGTYLAFTDTSEEMAKLGRKAEVIKSAGSDFKGMGLPGTTLSDEQRAFLQENADATNARFKRQVLDMRPKIAAEDMRGQFYRGSQAKAKGYSDGTITSVVNFLRQVG